MNGKIFQINVERNDNQSGSIFFLFFFYGYEKYCGTAWRQTFQECFEFITFHYSNCCILRVKSMRNNMETDRSKSAQYKVKSQRYKWLLLITEIFLKNPTNFLSAHVRICVKEATPQKIVQEWDHFIWAYTSNILVAALVVYIEHLVMQMSLIVFGALWLVPAS